MKDLHCTVNPLNDKVNYNKCFDYSIVLSMYSSKMGNNYNQLYKIKPYLNEFNFKNINYPLNGIPLKKEDYQTFERNNESIALNILKADESQDITYLFKSRHDSRDIKCIYY